MSFIVDTNIVRNLLPEKGSLKIPFVAIIALIHTLANELETQNQSTMLFYPLQFTVLRAS